jgi:endonuclease YncB( thermonuclease family)
MRFFSSALAAFLFVTTPALADITGPARVVDGDPLRVGDTKIRLVDIDAPERRQTCWRASGEFRCGMRATAVL